MIITILPDTDLEKKMSGAVISLTEYDIKAGLNVLSSLENNNGIQQNNHPDA